MYSRMIPFVVFVSLWASCRAKEDPVPDQFQGWDCGHVQNIELLEGDQTPLTCLAPSPPGTVLHTRPGRYTLLQLQDAPELPAYTCRLRTSRILAGCGMFEHLYIHMDASYIYKAEYVSEGQCREWWDRSVATFEGRKFSLHNGLNQFQYLEAGSLSKDGSCEGASLLSNGKNYTDVVSWVTVELELREEKVVLTTPFVGLPSALTPVECPPYRDTCWYDQKTVIWDHASAPKLCPYHIVGSKVSGEIETQEDNKEYFTSQGKVHLRVQVHDAIVACQQIIHATDQKGLFLTATHNTRPFQDIGKTTQSIEEVFPRLELRYLDNKIERSALLKPQRQEQKCQWKPMSYIDMPADQRHGRLPARATIPLGQGRFITAGATGWYRFECKAVILQAQNTSFCYDALPVHEVDRPRTDLLFLEPNTLRLLSNSTPRRCSDMAPYRIQTIDGLWRQVPRIVEMGTTVAPLMVLEGRPPTESDNRTLPNREQAVLTREVREIAEEAGDMITSDNANRTATTMVPTPTIPPIVWFTSPSPEPPNDLPDEDTRAPTSGGGRVGSWMTSMTNMSHRIKRSLLPWIVWLEASLRLPGQADALKVLPRPIVLPAVAPVRETGPARQRERIEPLRQKDLFVKVNDVMTNSASKTRDEPVETALDNHVMIDAPKETRVRTSEEINYDQWAMWNLKRQEAKQPMMT